MNQQDRDILSQLDGDIKEHISDHEQRWKEHDREADLRMGLFRAMIDEFKSDIRNVFKELPCKENTTNIASLKNESEIKDAEHSTQLKIQWVLIALMMSSVVGLAFFIIRKYI